jgi:hypothetical protein
LLGLLLLALAMWRPAGLTTRVPSELIVPIAVASAALVAWLVGLTVAARASTRAWAATAFGGVWLAILAAHTWIMPRTDNYGGETYLMAQFRSLTPEGTPLAVFEMDPSRALFYIDRPAQALATPGDLRRTVRQTGSCYLLTFRRNEPYLQQAGAVTPLAFPPASGFRSLQRRPDVGLYLVSRTPARDDS